MVVAQWPDHLLSLSEWDERAPQSQQRFELVEGLLVMVPRPTAFHQIAIKRLAQQVDAQLPTDLLLVPEFEIVTDPRYPASVRVPDLVLLPVASVSDNPARVDAGQVLLAIEVLSPGTTRTDKIMKAAEYADAGIGAYWIVDLSAPVTLTSLVLVDGEYELAASGSGRMELLSPVGVAIDLDRLLL